VVGTLWYVMYLRRSITTRAAGVNRVEVVQLEKSASEETSIVVNSLSGRFGTSAPLPVVAEARHDNSTSAIRGGSHCELPFSSHARCSRSIVTSGVLRPQLVDSMAASRWRFRPTCSSWRGPVSRKLRRLPTMRRARHRAGCGARWGAARRSPATRVPRPQTPRPIGRAARR
jgi:hypothetical protein